MDSGQSHLPRYDMRVRHARRLGARADMQNTYGYLPAIKIILVVMMSGANFHRNSGIIVHRKLWFGICHYSLRDSLFCHRKRVGKDSLSPTP
jgi:hypothetical protein